MSEINPGQPDDRHIEEINFIAKYKGELKHSGRMTFKSDLSLYLFTYADNARFFLSLHDLAPIEEPQTLAYAAQLNSEIVPHISIHESGLFTPETPERMTQPTLARQTSRFPISGLCGVNTLQHTRRILSVRYHSLQANRK